MLKAIYTMVIPGLIASHEHIENPALASWLKGAAQEPVAASYYELLLALFGYTQGQYHFAKLRAQYDGLDAASHWICADPIHLGVDVSHVYSLGNAYLELSPAALDEYVNLLNSELPSGVELHAPHPLRWYLKLDRDWDISYHFPDEILAKTIVDKLPQGRDRMAVKSVFNEIQMLLHNAPITRRRREQGLPTVDALWLWGVGRDFRLLPRVAWDCVQTNDALACALAELNGIKTATLSETVNGNVLWIDTHYQFKDANEQRHEYMSKNLKKLYVGNGQVYFKKKRLAQLKNIPQAIQDARFRRAVCWFRWRRAK